MVSKPVDGIAGVDAFRAVTEREVLALREARMRGEPGAADIFGHAGEDGRFEHHQRALGKARANGFAGALQGGEVGAAFLSDRGGDGDDDQARAFQHRRIIADGKTA